MGFPFGHANGWGRKANPTVLFISSLLNLFSWYHRWTICCRLGGGKWRGYMIWGGLRKRCWQENWNTVCSGQMGTQSLISLEMSKSGEPWRGMCSFLLHCKWFSIHSTFSARSGMRPDQRASLTPLLTGPDQVVRERWERVLCWCMVSRESTVCNATKAYENMSSVCAQILHINSGVFATTHNLMWKLDWTENRCSKKAVLLCETISTILFILFSLQWNHCKEKA